MFTGIIEETGIIKKIEKSGDRSVLTVSAEKTLEGTKVGDSIAVNGVCLTVTSITESSFSADVMNETLKRSSLKDTTVSKGVNLERAMAADGRFGGHIVSGHIDGTGIIRDIKKDGNAVWFYIDAPSDIMKYIIEKGSVALDGISLTVAGVSKNSFSVSVIPHTISMTCLFNKRKQDLINIENDCIGKYVEKLLMNENTIKSQSEGDKKNEITKDFLSKNGFR